MGSGAQAEQLWCGGSLAVVHGLCCSVACGILAPGLEIGPIYPALIGRWVLNHWTTREVQTRIFELLLFGSRCWGERGVEGTRTCSCEQVTGSLMPDGGQFASSRFLSQVRGASGGFSSSLNHPSPVISGGGVGQIIGSWFY